MGVKRSEYIKESAMP